MCEKGRQNPIVAYNKTIEWDMSIWNRKDNYVVFILGGMMLDRMTILLEFVENWYLQDK